MTDAFDPFAGNQGGDSDTLEVQDVASSDQKYIVADGLYEARVLSAKRSVGKESGKPMAVLEYALTGRVWTETGWETDATAGGKEFTGYYSVGAVWKIKKLLLAFGLDEFVKDGNVSIPLSAFPHKQCILTMKQETFREQVSSKPANEHPHPDGPVPAL